MSSKQVAVLIVVLLCAIGCAIWIATSADRSSRLVVAAPTPAAPPETEEARQARLKATRGEVLAAAKNDIEAKNYQRAYDELNALDIRGIANDPEYKRLFSRAKKELARARATAANQEHQAGIGARKEYAKSLREHFLDQNLDIKVRVSGAAADRLTMTFVLFNDVWVHNFMKGALMQEIWSKGFHAVYMENGYDYSELIRPN